MSRTRLLNALLLPILLLLVGCAAQPRQVYPGTRLSPDREARISTDSQSKYGAIAPGFDRKIYLTKINGESLSDMKAVFGGQRHPHHRKGSQAFRAGLEERQLGAALEGLPEQVEVAFGTVPERVRVKEGGLVFELDVLHGQKTGWFYDQHDNRDRLQPWVKNAKVLDLFSYVGAWGIRAAGFGAEDVTCVDASASAVAQIEANAGLNGFAGCVHAIRADAFEFLREARAEKRHWDVVILDPPAFIKRRKDFKEGALAYRRINEMAMQVLARDGILVSASCSHHMGRAALLEAIQTGARHLDRQVQVLCQLQQAADHPVHAAIPETDYLKGYIGRVLPA